MFLIKFSIYFLISYLILAFPIKTGTVFDHVNKYTAPLTSEVYKYIQVQLGNVSDKIFKKSLPPHLDKLNSRLSGVVKNKKTKPKRQESIPEDSYTVEEKQLLQKILRETQY